MKILQICDTYQSGGAQNVFRTTVRLLTNLKGNKVIAACCEAPQGNNYVTMHNCINSAKLLAALNYIYSYKNLTILNNILKVHKFDIIHIHGFLATLSPSILYAIKKHKVTCGYKVIETLHDYHVICPNSALYNYSADETCGYCVGRKFKIGIFFKRCDRRGMVYSWIKGVRSLISNNLLQHRELVDAFITPSEFLMQKMLEEGIKKDKLFVIKNPVDLSGMEYYENTPKQNLIVYFGRISPEKNIELLIRAFKDLLRNDQLKDYKLLLVGEGEAKDKIEKMIFDLGLNNKVDIKGFMTGDKLKMTIKPAKILVLPSKWYENAPLSIVEAALLGIIPIAADIGGMKESIDFLKIGETFRNQDEASLSNVMQKVILNYEFYKENNADTVTLIKKTYSEGAYLENIQDLYKKLSGI